MGIGAGWQRSRSGICTTIYKWYDIAYGRGVALLLPDGLPAFLVQCESIPVCRFT